jgi:PAS domain S-box-containing protein
MSTSSFFDSFFNSKAAQRFELANKASSEGLWEVTVIDHDPFNMNNELWMSDRLLELLGYSRQSVGTTTTFYMNLIHPNEKEAHFASFGEDLRQGKKTYDNKKIRLRLKNGEYRWFQERGALLHDNKGQLTRVAGTLKDIHEEVQQQQEVENLMRRLELITEASSEGFWDVTIANGDPNHPDSSVWYSMQMRCLLGYTSVKDFPNDISGWVNALHPDERDHVLEIFSAHVLDKSGSTPFQAEYQLRKKNGEYVWCRAKGITYRDEHGTPLKTAGFILDITNERLRYAYEQNIHQLVSQIISVIETLNEVVLALSEKTYTMSEGINNQLDQTNSIASAMEEMTAAITDSSTQASLAAEEAEHASENAQNYQ